MNTEEWRAIAGYDEYEVSSLGRVRKLTRGGPRILKLAVRHDYRSRVSIGLRGKTKSVHRLVATAFLGPCPDGYECSHLDGDSSNNAVTNLCWETHKENVARQFKHGTVLWGSKNGQAKLDADKVRAIRAKLRAGMPKRHIAREFGVSHGTVINVERGVHWRDVE